MFKIAMKSDDTIVFLKKVIDIKCKKYYNYYVTNSTYPKKWRDDMRKITEERARNLLENGKTIKCKISARDVIPVKDISKLNSLIKLKDEGVQLCEIFFEGEVKIPENAMEISLEDAMRLIAEGEIVYGKRKEEDEELTTQNVLMQFYRSAILDGEPVLYWIV